MIRKLEKALEDLLGHEVGNGDGIDGSYKGKCGCDIQAKRVLALMRQLRRSHLWPVSDIYQNKCLHEIVSTAKHIKLQLPKDAQACAPNTCVLKILKSENTLSKRLNDEASTWESSLNICLKCAQGEGLTGEKCMHR